MLWNLYYRNFLELYWLWSTLHIPLIPYKTLRTNLKYWNYTSSLVKAFPYFGLSLLLPNSNHHMNSTVITDRNTNSVKNVTVSSLVSKWEGIKMRAYCRSFNSKLLPKNWPFAFTYSSYEAKLYMYPLCTILSFKSILYYLLKITYQNTKLTPNLKMNEKLVTQDLSSTEKIMLHLMQQRLKTLVC